MSTGKPSKTMATTNIDWAPTLLLPTTFHDKASDNINSLQSRTFLTTKQFCCDDINNKKVNVRIVTIIRLLLSRSKSYISKCIANLYSETMIACCTKRKTQRRNGIKL